MVWNLGSGLGALRVSGFVLLWGLGFEAFRVSGFSKFLDFGVVGIWDYSPGLWGLGLGVSDLGALLGRGLFKGREGRGSAME